MTITEFLLARIADEEELANLRGTEPIYIYADGVVGYVDGEWEDGEPRLPNRHCDYAMLYDPTRVLAECAAKRALVELAGLIHDKITWEWGGCQSWKEDGWQEGNEGTETIRTLAAVYEDHIDYRGEWKP